MFRKVREAASSRGMANGKTMELTKQAARAIKNARTSILAMTSWPMSGPAL